MNGDKRGIPPEILQQIRDRVDLVEVISTHVKLTKAGQNYKGLCPFHSEKSPSFSVNPVQKMFYCFGCHIGGDAFTFLMKKEGMDFMEALRDLSQRTGVEIPERREPLSNTTSVLSRQRYYQLYQWAADWYHRNLQEAQEAETARQYLDQREISRESWKAYQLGYAPPGWNELTKWLERQSVKVEELIQAGLVVRKTQDDGRISTYDRFRGRVMFPIADPRGQVVGFGGRVLTEETSPKYLNSPETLLFNKGRSLYGMDKARPAAMSASRFYVVEGYFDVIALSQHGIPNAVAPLGTALTADHVQMLQRLVPAVTLVFDGDTAGVSAALRTLDLFLNSGLEVRVMLVPSGEDPDTFIRQHGVSGFRELEGHAATLLDFAVKTVLSQVKKESIQDRVKRADEILAILQKTTNPIEKDEYLKVVSERLGIRHELLRKRLPGLHRQIHQPGSPSSSNPSQSAPVLPQGKPEERDVIVLLLQSRLTPDQISQLTAEEFTVPLYRDLFSKAVAHVSAEGQVEVEAFGDEFQEQAGLASVIGQLSVWDLSYIEDVQAHVSGCLRVLKHKQIQRRMDELIGKLKEAERDGQQDLVDALLMEMNALREKKALLAVPS